MSRQSIVIETGNGMGKMYDELVTGLLDALEGRAERIVLYGSVARGTANEASVIDIAVLVRSPVDARTEDKLSDVVVDMNLKYDKVFSVIDIDNAVYNLWKEVVPFYRNVEREGIVLWKAA